MKLVKWMVRIVVIVVAVIAIQSAVVTANRGPSSTEDAVAGWASVFADKTVSAAETAADTAVQLKNAATNAVSDRMGG